MHDVRQARFTFDEYFVSLDRKQLSSLADSVAAFSLQIKNAVHSMGIDDWAWQCGSSISARSWSIWSAGESWMSSAAKVTGFSASSWAENQLRSCFGEGQLRGGHNYNCLVLRERAL